jgi:putative phage-type endonuclease
MNREQFLAERKKGVGGSDVHALFNLPPRGCQRALWYDKTNVPEDFPFTGNNHTQRGIELEALIADKYSAVCGRQTGMALNVVHGQLPVLRVNIDRIILPVRDDSTPGVLECKAPSVREFLRIKREGLPDSWILQMQHGLHVTGWSWGAFAVFSAELWELLTFPVERDPVMGLSIQEAALRFWRLVENGPPPDRLDPGDRRCQTCPWRTTCQGEALLQSVQEHERGDPLPSDPSLEPLVQDYLTAKGIRDDADEFLEQAKERLQTALGDRVAVESPSARCYYRPQEQRRLDTTALRKDHPELAAQYERKSVLRPLRVIAL